MIELPEEGGIIIDGVYYATIDALALSHLSLSDYDALMQSCREDTPAS